MGRRGAAARVLARDMGGMPVWALILSALLAIGAVGAFSALSAAPSSTATFTPPTGAATPELPQPMPLAVFLGDSYTQGVGGGGVTWPELIGVERRWDVANLALGGTGYLRTSDASGCGRPYCGSYREVSEEIVGSPRFIFVAGGRNDLRLDTDEVGVEAAALFEDLRDRYPAAQLFVINPWYDDDLPPAQLAELDDALRTAAESADAVFLDTGQPLSDRPDLIGDDGIHPNAAGYRALTAAIEDELAGHLSP